MELVLIPAGEFMMGSPESEKDRGNDESQHRVTLSKPFYLGKYEVTQGEWEQVMGTKPWRGREERCRGRFTSSGEFCELGGCSRVLLETNSVGTHGRKAFN